MRKFFLGSAILAVCWSQFCIASPALAAAPAAKGKPPITLSGPEPNVIYDRGQLTNTGSSPALDIQIPAIGFYTKILKPGESVSLLGTSPGMGILEGKYGYVDFTQNARQNKTFEINLGSQPGQVSPDVMKKTGGSPGGSFGPSQPRDLTRIKNLRTYYDWDEHLLMVEVVTKEDTEDVIIVLKNRYPIAQRADLVRGVTEQFFEANVQFGGQAPVALTHFGKKATFSMEVKKTPGVVAEKVIIAVQTTSEYREIELFIPTEPLGAGARQGVDQSPSGMFASPDPSGGMDVSPRGNVVPTSDDVPRDLGAFARRLLQMMGEDTVTGTAAKPPSEVLSK